MKMLDLPSDCLVTAAETMEMECGDGIVNYMRRFDLLRTVMPVEQDRQFY